MEIIENQFTIRVLVLGFKALTILVGFGLAYLGYRLFKSGIWGDSGDLVSKFGDWKIVLKNGAPGTYFTICGTVVIVFTILQGGSFSDSVTVPKGNNYTSESKNENVRKSDSISQYRDSIVLSSGKIISMKTAIEKIKSGEPLEVMKLQPIEYKEPELLEPEEPLEILEPREPIKAQAVAMKIVESTTHFAMSGSPDISLHNKYKYDIIYKSGSVDKWVVDTLRTNGIAFIDLNSDENYRILYVFDSTTNSFSIELDSIFRHNKYVYDGVKLEIID